MQNSLNEIACTGCTSCSDVADRSMMAETLRFGYYLPMGSNPDEVGDFFIMLLAFSMLKNSMFSNLSST